MHKTRINTTRVLSCGKYQRAEIWRLPKKSPSKHVPMFCKSGAKKREYFTNKKKKMIRIIFRNIFI